MGLSGSRPNFARLVRANRRNEKIQVTHALAVRLEVQYNHARRSVARHECLDDENLWRGRSVSRIAVWCDGVYDGEGLTGGVLYFEVRI
jgi:hypothetical protein